MKFSGTYILSCISKRMVYSIKNALQLCYLVSPSRLFVHPCIFHYTNAKKVVGGGGAGGPPNTVSGSAPVLKLLNGEKSPSLFTLYDNFSDTELNRSCRLSNCHVACRI